MQNLVSESDFNNTVIFTGHRNDGDKILSKCKVLLMSSWAEPSGVIVIEAMAAGVPVIGANSGGVKEIIEDGVTGYLVSP